MSKVYIGKPGEGKPLNAAKGPREGVVYTEHRSEADEVVHLVNGGGKRLSNRKAEQVRASWHAKTSHREGQHSSWGGKNAPKRSVVQQQRDKGRGGVLFFALVFYVVGFVALASQGAGAIIVWVFLGALMSIPAGYMLRGFFRMAASR